MKYKKTKIIIAIVLSVAAVVILTSAIDSFVGSPSDYRAAMYVEDTPDKVKSRQIIYNGETANLTYTFTINRQAAANGKVTSKYGAVDEYIDENGNNYYYFYNTNELCGFSGLHKSEQGSLTKEKATEIARTRLSEYVDMNSYELQKIHDYEQNGYFIVTFAKKIGGVFTEDSCSYNIDLSGWEQSWMLYNTGRFNEQKITDKKIETARKSLMNIIEFLNKNKKWSVTEEYLTINEKEQVQLVIKVSSSRDAGGGHYVSDGKKYFKTIR